MVSNNRPRVTKKTVTAIAPSCATSSGAGMRRSAAITTSMLQRAMRIAFALFALAACSDPYNGKLSPEQAMKAPDGHLVVVIGTVFATTWDSTQTMMRKQELIDHAGDMDWILEQNAEEARGKVPAYDDAGAHYPRTPDHYILFRTKKPPGITQGDPDFTPGALAAAWTLGVHLTDDIDPAV